MTDKPKSKAQRWAEAQYDYPKWILDDRGEDIEVARVDRDGDLVLKEAYVSKHDALKLARWIEDTFGVNE